VGIASLVSHRNEVAEIRRRHERISHGGAAGAACQMRRDLAIFKESIVPSAKYLRRLEVKFKRGHFKNPIREQVREPEQIYSIFKDIKDETKEVLLGVYLGDDLDVRSYEVLTVGTRSATLCPTDDIFAGPSSPRRATSSSSTTIRAAIPRPRRRTERYRNAS
jgi:hypothetical protein